jgi:competence protein ComEA
VGRAIDRLRQSRWLAGGLAGGLGGVIFLLVFLLARSPRDTVILKVEPDPDPNELRVWVGGEVARPGIYTFDRGDRVADALKAAGGALESGDTSGLGLAAPLADSDQVIVPPKPAAAAPATTFSATGQTPPASGSVVNINTASAAQLEELPGIGPVLAERVVAYREQNGPFQSVDELAEVAGISDRMVDELRALITTG